MKIRWWVEERQNILQKQSPALVHTLLDRDDYIERLKTASAIHFSRSLRHGYKIQFTARPKSIGNQIS